MQNNSEIFKQNIAKSDKQNLSKNKGLVFDTPPLSYLTTLFWN